MPATMTENHQSSPSDRPSQLFCGIRFVLHGFDPTKKAQVSLKLVNGGGVNAGQYGPNCTHVIVDKLVYDDPICVSARRDGKILVTSLWVDHSFDVGAPVDTSAVMYMPARDLNGIPGARSLVICLTGYQREDREDIMTMVELMGAQFSKPLIANKVTHLICYKFEGEKYLLAKKMKRIKLINHRWLEDCLKAWEIVLEANYSKSGYELEMEAEAKDSEEEPEGVIARQSERKIGSPSTQNKIISSSIPANKSPENGARNVVSATRITSPTIDMKSNTGSAKRSNKCNPSDAFNMSSSLVHNVDIDIPNNASAFCPNDTHIDSFSGKRKMDIACGSFDRQKMSPNNDVGSAFQELKDPLTEISHARKTPFNTPGRKSLSSKGKNVICDVPISKLSTLETEALDAVQGLQKKDKEIGLTTKFDSRNSDMVENVIQSPSAVSSDIQKFSNQNLEINEQTGGSTSKSVRRKSTSKKISSPNLTKKNTFNKKGSALLKNTVPRNNYENLMNHQNLDVVSEAAKSGTEINLEVNNGLQTENMSGNKSLCMDDETEPPEDKDEENKKRHVDVEPENINVVMEEVPEGDLHDVDQHNDENNLMSINKVIMNKSGDIENVESERTSRGTLNKKGKKTARSVKKKELASDNNNEKPEVREESTSKRARRTKRNVNDLEKSAELHVPQDACNDLDVDNVNADLEKEHVVSKKETKRNKRLPSKTKVSVNDDTDVKAVINKKAKRTSSSCDLEAQEERVQIHVPEFHVVNMKETKRNKRLPSKTKVSVKDDTDVKAVNKKAERTSSRCDLEAQEEKVQSRFEQVTAKKEILKPGKEFPEKNLDKMSTDVSKDEPMCFILTGPKLQRREFQQIIKRLKGRVCRVSHQWSYQATHFIVPDPIRRTEKFFAAAAAGRWILKTDYLSASNQAGKFLPEETYEWHKNGLSEDGQINLEAPRKWRLLKEKTGHSAFYGMTIIIYGECIAPTLDTLKRVVKAGDGTILATSPPYTRFLNTGIDFAVVSPGTLYADIWVQEFLKHEIPCVYADYLVEYVCKPGYPLERHVQYDTNSWAERSCNRLKKLLEEEICEPRTPDGDDVECEVCGSRDRGDEMLICGDERGLIGCGAGTHIDCCDPPLESVPEGDWFCVKCSKKPKSKRSSKRKGSASRG
ncbi:hypothetical protein SSX86_004878 [Deinandra increscens subsp. villosa]|uniref:BRCT domain-containing protein n=1 Tax=Deinandra increscens subsp. villosa TaxID=3103831 RepID=A0AAP0H7Z4_9ASTR